MKWQEYQQQSASLFRTLGLIAKVEFKVEGARGIHVIDVFAEGSFHGIEFKWAIECKAWKSNVPKEKVMAFASIVQDIGADRGFLLSEKGFQSGAIRSAQRTNITLTSLADLAETIKEKAEDAAIGNLYWRLEKARNRLREIRKEMFDGDYIPPMLEHFGELSALGMVLQEALKYGFPLRYRTNLEFLTLDHLLNYAEKKISCAEQWVPPDDLIIWWKSRK